MARLTTRDLCKNLGLGTSGTDYVGATIFLKILCEKGLVKEVDRIVTSNSGKGRRSVVYEIPEVISLRLLSSASIVVPVPMVVAAVPVPMVVAAVPPAVQPVVVATAPTAPQQFTWGDDDEDEEAA
jgi:hypothetical protein